MNMPDRVVSAEESFDERSIDSALRPQRIDEFIGQRAVLEQVSIVLEAAKRRNDPLDHILLYGPPGLGKTSLAQIFAAEMGVKARMTSGPAMEHQGMLASILTGLDARDVLFIDEIHRLNHAVEEALYPAMEDFALDWIAGKGAGAQALRLALSPFTVIAATTRPGALSSPLRDRFGITFRLDFYDVEELTGIVKRSARLLQVDVDEAGAGVIAARGRGTPRIANRLLRRARDFAQVRANGHINAEVAEEALRVLGVDEAGLDDMDRRVLQLLCGPLRGHPVGLNTLAVSVQEDPDTIEDVVEPFLIRLGFVTRTPRGRLATAAAYEYLGAPVPDGVPGSGEGQSSFRI